MEVQSQGPGLQFPPPQGQPIMAQPQPQMPVTISKSVKKRSVGMVILGIFLILFSLPVGYIAVTSVIDGVLFTMGGDEVLNMWPKALIAFCYGVPALCIFFGGIVLVWRSKRK